MNAMVRDNLKRLGYDEVPCFICGDIYLLPDVCSPHRDPKNKKFICPYCEADNLKGDDKNGTTNTH